MIRLTDFIPFFTRSRGAPRRPPKFDVERALSFELHVHPTLRQIRAVNGELIAEIQRDLLPAERFLSRFFRIDRRRRIVLDRYGEFVLTRALVPGTRLAEIAADLATSFEIEPEQARLGVIQLVRELMLRGFVFLVNRGGDRPS